MVTKNKKKERASMTTAALSSIMTHKLAMQNRDITCFSASYTESTLKNAKSATYRALHHKELEGASSSTEK